jgi:hypothetical protein
MIGDGCLAHKAIFKVINRTESNIKNLRLTMALMNQRLRTSVISAMPERH